MDRPSKILILGAGYGGLAAARTLEAAVRRHRHPPDVTLVDRRTQHQLTTQLHEVAAATLEPEFAAVPLERLLVRRPITFIHDEVRGIDCTHKRVALSRGQLAYDFLVIALGSETEFFGIPGLTEHAFRLRWLEEALTLRHHLAGVLRRAMTEPRPDRRALLEHVIVGGGGYTGVELITEVADGLRSAAGILAGRHRVAPPNFSLTLVEASSEIMTGFRPEIASKAKERLARKGIAVRTSAPIVHVKPETVHLKSGETLEASTVVWTGGIRAVPTVAQSGLATAHRGRGTVDQFLRSVSDPSVFIVGDSAYATDPATGAPLAPSAQLAVKQGEHVGRLIYRTLLGLEPVPFAPGRLPVIVSLGVDYALADLGWLVLRGRLARALKRLAVVRYLYGLDGIGLALRHAPEVLEGVPIIGTPPGRLAA